MPGSLVILVKASFTLARDNTPRRARLGDDNFTQQRQLRSQVFPNPDRDVFAGGVFQAGDFVEITVIELFPERLERFGNVRVIHQPAELGIALAGDDNFRLKTVAVQSAAFMRGRQLRQQVRRFELKSSAQFHFHLMMMLGSFRLCRRLLTSLFPIRPGHQVAKTGPPVVPPRQRGGLHLPNGANACDAPTGEFDCQLFGSHPRRGQSHRRNFAAHRLGRPDHCGMRQEK